MNKTFTHRQACSHRYFYEKKLQIVKGLVAALWIAIFISFSSLSVFSDVSKKSMFNTLQCKLFNAPGSNNKK